MKIESIAVAKIKPSPYNPRADLKKGDRAYEDIQRSLDEFGMVEPIVWNKATGHIVGGHQRFKILKSMGAKKIDVSVVDIKDPEKEKALNLALNKVSGEWDIPRLKELLVELDTGQFDLKLTGFDEFELKKLIDYDGKAGNTDDDAVPDRPAQPSTVKGDLYQLGEHRLLCGDARNGNDAIKLMNGQFADMVFTDPPYNVDYEGRTDKKLKIQNDKMTPAEFEAFLAASFVVYSAVVKKGASLYVCHSSSCQREFQNALEQAGFEIRCQLIWAKNTFGWGFGRYKFQHEPIFYAYVDGQKDPWYGDKTQSTLWQENKPTANRLHPTMKPVELILRALNNSTKAGDLVLDLFGGAGSTLIACEKTARKCALMELDPGYCDVIVKRWEEFTGKRANKVV